MEKNNHVDNILPRYYRDGEIPIPAGYWAMMPNERGVSASFPAKKIRIQEAVEYAKQNNKSMNDFTSDELMLFIDGYSDESRDNTAELDSKIDNLVSYLLRDDIPLERKQNESTLLNWLLELRMYRRENIDSLHEDKQL